VLFYSGDDADAKAKLRKLLERAGHFPIDLGVLDVGGPLASPPFGQLESHQGLMIRGAPRQSPAASLFARHDRISEGAGSQDGFASCCCAGERQGRDVIRSSTASILSTSPSSKASIVRQSAHRNLTARKMGA
jgi:hypothetical protein